MTTLWAVLFAATLLAALYATSLYNYLLFHSLAEVFSIVIAGGIFMMAWNTRQFLKNGYLTLLGIAYLFIGGLDLFHTLAFKGMNVFPAHGTNLPTQLWVAGRAVECLSLAVAPLFLRRPVRTDLIFAGYTLVTILLLLSIFVWPVFPVCFVEGVGLTPFKRALEYCFCAMLVAAIALLLKHREAFDPRVLKWLVWSMILTIGSELSFTLYLDAYAPANLIGHYFKILSFYLVYKAIIQTGLTQPHALLFRELKQSEDRYHSLFTHTASGVAHYQIVLDAAGQPVDYVFLEVNDVFERLTRLSRDDVIGKRVTQVIPGIERGPVDWIRLYGEVALKGQAARFDHFSERLRRWFSVTAYCPEPGFFVTVLEDITERKDAEAALRAAQQQLLLANETLEGKVRQRTAQLQETVTDLEHFSYSVVHDMRAPLRAMQSFAGFVLEEAPGPLDAQCQDYLHRIISSAQRLDTLIRDVLSYTKIARGEFSLGPVVLDGLVDDIVRDYPMFQANRAGIEIQHPLLPVVGNTALLTQCISNFLGNAVKFVAPGTRPEVKVWTEASGDGWVRFCVQDNGVGIHPDHLDRIWRIFERLHHSAEFPGTGIGLSVVKRAIQRMGGIVGVESKPGMGSVFWFKLPQPTVQGRPP